jgi:hypothetical protein
VKTYAREAHLLDRRRRREDQVEVARVETERDRATGGAEEGELLATVQSPDSAQ